MRINDQISAASVRLIDEDGAQLGMVALEDAIQKATEAGRDLVEVAPDADPPVCKLMDYGKYKYRQKKKIHQSRTKHHAARIKELRFKLKTDKHDVAIKVQHARKFLEKKHKVLLTMFLRGHLEVRHSDLGVELLNEIAVELEDVAKLEKEPALDGRRVQMILAPK